MLLLAVDPGSNGTGWAAFWRNSGKLWNWGTIYAEGSNWNSKAKNVLKEYKRVLSSKDFSNVYIESPVFMHGYGGYTTASTGALVKLSMLCGAMYFMATEKSNVILVSPSKWKGQLPKSVCHTRIKEIVEKQNVHESLGKVSSHALDAIGLGLWALGRFE